MLITKKSQHLGLIKNNIHAPEIYVFIQLKQKRL